MTFILFKTVAAFIDFKVSNAYYKINTFESPLKKYEARAHFKAFL